MVVIAMYVTQLLVGVSLVISSFLSPVIAQGPKKVRVTEVIPPFVLNNNETILYLQAVKFTVINEASKARSAVNLTKIPEVSTSTEGKIVTLDIKYPDTKTEDGKVDVTGFALRLKLESKRGYWSLNESLLSVKAAVTGEPPLEYNNAKLVTRMELAAPLNRSFHCGRFGPFSPKIIDLKNKGNATVSIELIDFQLQTFVKGEAKFGRSYDCVGFFSIGILSGWFITILLLGLLTWGIKMVMNINTMDRFDDPKGKTITVHATD